MKGFEKMDEKKRNYFIVRINRSISNSMIDGARNHY
jgi:hypothetical protein